jgi:hypothetical protein
MRAKARAGCAANMRQAAAMWEDLAHRRRPIVVFRNSAITWGM